MIPYTSKYILFSIFLCLMTTVHATTYIGQHIDKDTKWKKENSPYVITIDLAVVRGSTLEIEAGTKVYFSKETSLTIGGNLIAKGTSNQKIFFGGFNNHNWNGFLFTKECNDFDSQTKKGCIFEHCIFKGTGESPAQLVRSKGCDIYFSNCSVTNCYTAIQTERQAEIWVYSSSFENCNRVLNIRNTSSATVENNKMIACNSIMLGGTTIFKGNILKKFSGKGRHSGLVVWMLGGGIIDISNNEFSNFNEYAIKLYKMTRRSTFVVENNKFKNNAINLSLSSHYYNRGKSKIENNNFYNYKNYHIEITPNSSSEQKETIQKVVIGTNYWGNLSVEDIHQKATLDASTSSNKKITAKVEYTELAKKVIK